MKPETNLESQISEEEPKTVFTLRNVAIGGSVLLLAAGGGVFAYMQRNKKEETTTTPAKENNKPAAEPTPTPNPAAVSKVDTTAAWAKSRKGIRKAVVETAYKDGLYKPRDKAEQDHEDARKAEFQRQRLAAEAEAECQRLAELERQAAEAEHAEILRIMAENELAAERLRTAAREEAERQRVAERAAEIAGHVQRATEQTERNIQLFEEFLRLKEEYAVAALAATQSSSEREGIIARRGQTRGDIHQNIAHARAELATLTAQLEQAENREARSDLANQFLTSAFSRYQYFVTLRNQVSLDIEHLARQRQRAAERAAEEQRQREEAVRAECENNGPGRAAEIAELSRIAREQTDELARIREELEGLWNEDRTASAGESALNRNGRRNVGLHADAASGVAEDRLRLANFETLLENTANAPERDRLAAENTAAFVGEMEALAETRTRIERSLQRRNLAEAEGQHVAAELDASASSTAGNV